jgi:two-component system phosphate regulon response regulator PhoB
MPHSDTLLLVEDDPDLSEILRNFLNYEGFTVVCASDGVQAIQLLHSSVQPDLVLLDWMMPKMGARQFCEQLKRKPGLENIPVILLTAAGKIDEKVTEIGAVAGVAKPLEFKTLLAAIQNALKSGAGAKPK